MLALVEDLLLHDTALSASYRGGTKWRGWTREAQAIADVYNAINTNTRATGQWKKGRAPDFPAYPRPTNENTRVTVASLRQRFGLFRKG